MTEYVGGTHVPYLILSRVIKDGVPLRERDV